LKKRPWAGISAAMMLLSEIAEALGGQVIQGDPGMEISGVAGVEAAGPSELSFYESAKYKNAALASGAGALLVREILDGHSAAQVQAASPYLQFLEVVRLFHPEVVPAVGVH